ncbi:MAG: DsbA family protein [Candidatus Sungbacteria bacterium]|nr:DsbA family protein [Candidatus Sungbacteria bacterium]
MEEQVQPPATSSPAPQESGASPYLIPGAIIVAGLLIAGAVMFSDRPAGGVLPAGTPKKTVLLDTKSLEAGAPTLGNPDAAVSIVEFADFQCPFCGRFFKTTEREIIATYIKPNAANPNAGKVKLVYRHFAFLGPESEWAAEASECANEQRRFWDYHDYLYMHQGGENQGAFAKDNLKRFAKELSLNTDQFARCLDTEKYLPKVRKDTKDAQQFGVNATPSSFVNGKLLQGALPFAEFDEAIQAALAQSGAR